MVRGWCLFLTSTYPVEQGWLTFRSSTLLQSFLATSSEGRLRYQKGEYMRPPKGFLQLYKILLSS